MPSVSSLFVTALLSSIAAAQTHTGTLFNFVPGLGACGFTNTSSQTVASVSSQVFNSFPGAGPNPNNNPICKHSVTISHNGVNLTAPIVDFCAQCPQFNVGLSAVAFQKFAPLSDGIVPNVTWEIV
ncbi:unnamed protein product [Somion occarium]|uniref:RlpA-like protein double-psi beta-barrel domain-containing protein n=1 Tax=Somion occarium TaxID=3059160 RepID=A0ABP1DV43_9APHY